MKEYQFSHTQHMPMIRNINIIQLIEGNKTEFYFIYHVKGLSRPSMIMLLPQFRCEQSYMAKKLHKKVTKRYELV